MHEASGIDVWVAEHQHYRTVCVFERYHHDNFYKSSNTTAPAKLKFRMEMTKVFSKLCQYVIYAGGVYEELSSGV